PLAVGSMSRLPLRSHVLAGVVWRSSISGLALPARLLPAEGASIAGEVVFQVLGLLPDQRHDAVEHAGRQRDHPGDRVGRLLVREPRPASPRPSSRTSRRAPRSTRPAMEIESLSA